jgi:hypothetical protein
MRQRALELPPAALARVKMQVPAQVKMQARAAIPRMGPLPDQVARAD